MNRPNEAHHIVVIGDRADSFVLAARLGHELGRDGQALVTFVDQSMSTRWTPFLHEVEGAVFNEAAGYASPAMPKKVHPFQLRLGRIDAIDRVKKGITRRGSGQEAWGRINNTSFSLRPGPAHPRGGGLRLSRIQRAAEKSAHAGSCRAVSSDCTASARWAGSVN